MTRQMRATSSTNKQGARSKILRVRSQNLNGKNKKSRKKIYITSLCVCQKSGDPNSNKQKKLRLNSACVSEIDLWKLLRGREFGDIDVLFISDKLEIWSNVNTKKKGGGRDLSKLCMRLIHENFEKLIDCLVIFFYIMTNFNYSQTYKTRLCFHVRKWSLKTLGNLLRLNICTYYFLTKFKYSHT